MKTGDLAVAPDLTSGLMCEAGGSPVWPYRTDKDLAILVAVARLFRRKTRSAVPIARPSIPRGGLVLALGKEAWPAGRLYAHLTSRGLRKCGNPAEISRLPRIDVIVTASGRLTEDVFDRIYRRALKGDAPGIIFGDTEEELRRQVLIRSAAAHLSPFMPASRVDIVPTLNVARAREEGVDIYGSRASARQVRRALTQGAGALTIATHSDGLDAFLGHSLTLCPMNALPRSAVLAPEPECIASGFCHRQRVPLKEALASGRLVWPESISAGLLLFMGCFGLRIPGPVLSGAWARFLGKRLMANPAIGAQVTSWDVVSIGADEHEPLVADLGRGTPVGRALGRFLRSKTILRRGLRYCLLGDPRLRLARSTNGLRARGVLTEKSDEQQIDVRDNRSASFLRAYLQVVRSSAAPRHRQAATRALQSLAACERRGRLAASRSEIATSAVVMREAVCCLVVDNCGFTSNWIRFGGRHRLAAGTRPPCPGCENPTRATVIEFRARNLRARRLTSCPACGVIEDAPVDGALGLRVTAGVSVELVGKRPSLSWTARVALMVRDGGRSVSFSWPKDSAGRPRAMFKIPTAWPEGLVRVVFVMVAGHDVTTLELPVRVPRPK